MAHIRTLAFGTWSPLRPDYEATPLHVIFVWLSLGFLCGSRFGCHMACNASPVWFSMCLFCFNLARATPFVLLFEKRQGWWHTCALLHFGTLSPLRFDHEATPLHVMLVGLSLGIFCGSSFGCPLVYCVAQVLHCNGVLVTSVWVHICSSRCWSSRCWPQTCVSVAAPQWVCWRITWHSTCRLKSCLLFRILKGCTFSTTPVL